MKFVGVLADRLLSAVVPEIKAGACCTDHGKQYNVPCDLCAGNEVGLEKHCYVNCYCQGICTGCTVRYYDPGCR